MLARNWKRICIIILIIACLFNIVAKLVNKISLNTELNATVDYLQKQHELDKEENVIKN